MRLLMGMMGLLLLEEINAWNFLERRGKLGKGGSGVGHEVAVYY